MDTCPSAEELRRAIVGDLDAVRQRQVERHVEQCVDCQNMLDAVVNRTSVVPVPRERLSDGYDSAALKQVIDHLIDGPASASAAAEMGWRQDQETKTFPFLHPPELPGYLGRLGPFSIRRLIGRGGMGFVFEALDPTLKRTVAIKVLSPVIAASERSKQRFLREARAAAALSHENIVGIHSIHTDGELPFLALQFVDGESLADRLRREGRLAFHEVVRIGLETARGLEVAHAKGLFHRDIKPGNLLLERGTGRVKIADFGLVKDTNEATLTSEGTVAGTPEFMSPEQAGGRELDARSDLFSLGAVLYLAATGISPFAASSAYLVLERVRQANSRPIQQVEPSLPTWFSAIVDRLLAKDPNDRIESAAQLVDLLEHSAKPASCSRRPPKKTLWGLAGLLGLFLVFTAVGIALRHLSNRPGGPSAPMARPESGFMIVGRPEHYREPGEALAAIRDGEIIEIYGEGPYPCPPLKIEGKRLTMRAANQSTPVFISEAPSADSKAPLILTDADLHLEGLTIYWRTGAPPPIKPESSMLASSAVAATRGSLRLSHCRVIAAGGCNCVAVVDAEVALDHCHLVSGSASAVYWRPSPGRKAAIENCVLEGPIGLTFPTAADATGTEPATLKLSHNTFVVDNSIQLIVQLGPKQTVLVDARGNIFDHHRIVQLYATRFPRNLLPDTAKKRQSLLQSIIKWSDESNLYRRGQTLSLSSVLAPREAPKVDMLPLVDWLGIWQLNSPASAEARMHFQNRETKETESPKLVRVEDASGPVPPSVGADPDHVGPRR